MKGPEPSCIEEVEENSLYGVIQIVPHCDRCGSVLESVGEENPGSHLGAKAAGGLLLSCPDNLENRTGYPVLSLPPDSPTVILSSWAIIPKRLMAFPIFEKIRPETFGDRVIITFSTSR
ncbi:MAG: hypothetical protein XE01_1440 [Synergistales bacterium 58_81]|nr:MAG: hypothetical protein XE01_1440 [Synergistales bacterium 58_81]